jgi:hypothetical protein
MAHEFRIQPIVRRPRNILDPQIVYQHDLVSLVPSHHNSRCIARVGALQQDEPKPTHHKGEHQAWKKHCCSVLEAQQM